MYVLFEDNAYNLALDISLAGEQTDEEDNTYLLVLGTEMDGTEWTIYIYDTTMYLFLNNRSYYIFKNIKEY